MRLNIEDAISWCVLGPDEPHLTREVQGLLLPPKYGQGHRSSHPPSVSATMSQPSP